MLAMTESYGPLDELAWNDPFFNILQILFMKLVGLTKLASIPCTPVSLHFCFSIENVDLFHIGCQAHWAKLFFKLNFSDYTLSHHK